MIEIPAPRFHGDKRRGNDGYIMFSEDLVPVYTGVLL